MNAKELGNMPAYPTPGQDCVYASDGLTKREAFAMAAMQGLCANPAVIHALFGVRELETVANCANKFTEWTLAELAKDQP